MLCHDIFFSNMFSQGEEWYRGRSVLIQKTLRPKEVIEYIGPMNEVSNDFMKRLISLRTNDGTVPNLEREMFKWAMECKNLLFI